MITITIAGNLGDDAKMGQAGKTDVCNFSVACETFDGKDKETVWFDVAIWGERGDKICQYLTKGSKVTVVGRFSTREHDGKTYYKVDSYDVALQGDSSKNNDRGRDDRSNGHREESRSSSRGDDRGRDSRGSRDDDRSRGNDRGNDSGRGERGRSDDRGSSRGSTSY